MAAELESHLQMHVDERVRAGVSPEDARREAVLKLGGVEQTKEAYRERAGLPLLNHAVRDARFAARQLARSPGFAVTALVVLALATGASVAMFAFVDAALLRPLPYRDPSRLVSSAGRLYGDRMDALWGEVVPVPEDRVIPLTDGETQEAAGHVLSVLFSPGHASHHVAYWEPDLGVVFTGDVGGVRMPGSDYVLPPAPPPDLAPDDWAISTERLRQAGPRRLYLTHGGPFDDVAAHLEQLMPNLAEVEEICRAAMLGGADDEAVTDLLQAHTEQRIGAAATEDAEFVQRYGWASPSVLSALGFRRLFSRRGDRKSVV